MNKVSERAQRIQAGMERSEMTDQCDLVDELPGCGGTLAD